MCDPLGGVLSVMADSWLLPISALGGLPGAEVAAATVGDNAGDVDGRGIGETVASIGPAVEHAIAVNPEQVRHDAP